MLLLTAFMFLKKMVNLGNNNHHQRQASPAFFIAVNNANLSALLRCLTLYPVCIIFAAMVKRLYYDYGY